MNSYNFTAYLIYLPIVILLTWYVAYTLFKNARVFMMDIFNGRAEIALATNKLFETGFYLLNIGFALHIMEIGPELTTGRVLLEELSTKIGGFAFYLGVMLFLNLYLFFRGKRVARERRNGKTLPPAAAY
ncbi:hypothetical protein EPD60_08235 [Flaviaesturariibacter flavus]|uniref:Integral membrane protein n=1 Tax=Flaviaesturariibacter flavus TaxID=2502780 RepID=A0A4R1BAM1_9BACT|nr:hypothetical protein [Flaviaesturariibacter flavus]TCJ13994.1 hypothetical protein EPD60_08235 [Flaviaesturariibacter flavus]